MRVHVVKVEVRLASVRSMRCNVFNEMSIISGHNFLLVHGVFCLMIGPVDLVLISQRDCDMMYLISMLANLSCTEKNSEKTHIQIITDESLTLQKFRRIIQQIHLDRRFDGLHRCTKIRNLLPLIINLIPTNINRHITEVVIGRAVAQCFADKNVDVDVAEHGGFCDVFLEVEIRDVDVAHRCAAYGEVEAHRALDR